MDQKGIFYILTIPENISDLYNLPCGVTSDIKSYLQQDFSVRMDSPAQVALFAYDNGAFAVESFLDRPMGPTRTNFKIASHRTPAWCSRRRASLRCISQYSCESPTRFADPSPRAVR